MTFQRNILPSSSGWKKIRKLGMLAVITEAICSSEKLVLTKAT
jgi:hypothetical protein